MRYSPLMLLIAIGCTPPGKPVPPVADAETESLKLFATHCAGCHGASGNDGVAPPLADDDYLNIASTDGLNVIRNGRKGTMMPAFSLVKGGPLSDTQITSVSKSIRILLGPTSASNSNYSETLHYSNAGNESRGKILYQKACANCHGQDGSGGKDNDRLVGAINNPAYLALISNQLLWRYIITGRGKMMPFYDRSRLIDGKKLTEQEINDLTAYLASWRKKP